MVNIKYIAHPGQSLEDHLKGVGDKAKVFASKIGLADHGEVIGLLHDLGKYSDQFQSYIRSAIGQLNPDDDEYVDAGMLKGKVDHSSAGAQYVWAVLSSKGQSESIVAQILALCIASHHSGLIDCICSDSKNFGEDIFTKRMKKVAEKTHIDEVMSTANTAIIDRCLQILQGTDLILSINELIQRIAKSNGNSNIDITMQQIGLVVRFLFSCLIDADRIDTADACYIKAREYRQLGNYVGWDVLSNRLEAHLKCIAPSKPIDYLRRDISQHCFDAASRGPGIYTLTVPTGGGKTLASMRFALHHANICKLERIIYVIPFTSIIDQNAQVVRGILEHKDYPEDQGLIVLEHHSNLTPERQGWHEKILCESWDAPVVYTTMVQLLEALFGPGTRGARRMHQLSNAVIIFDEIQNLPIKCVHLFNNAINFLAQQCNSTILLCTATQPLLHKVKDSKGAIRLHKQHEIMPDVQQLFDDLQRVEIADRCKSEGWSCAEISELAITEFNRLNSCLVIVNTKSVAKKIYMHAANQTQKDEIYHLSTDMCAAHRKHVLSIIRQRLVDNKKVLCISTQLIEAGVDVDFHVVIRSKAGLDAIAQAAGRCNRNGRLELGIVHVVNISEERIEKLNDIYIGQRVSDRIINDYKDDPESYGNSLIGPKAISDYYQFYFFERQLEMDYKVMAKDLGHDDTLLSMLSRNKKAVTEYSKTNNTKTEPNIFLRQAFMTAATAFKAIDAPTQGVIVPYGAAGKALISEIMASNQLDKEYKLLKIAQQYTVNIFPNILKVLTDNAAIHKIQDDLNIMYLKEDYYSEEFGLIVDIT